MPHGHEWHQEKFSVKRSKDSLNRFQSGVPKKLRSISDLAMDNNTGRKKVEAVSNDSKKKRECRASCCQNDDTNEYVSQSPRNLDFTVESDTECAQENSIASTQGYCINSKARKNFDEAALRRNKSTKNSNILHEAANI